ncbi:MAG: hypothetical protein J6N77_02285 [Lachnospiraceae bacterium]|nr:hypothetical protein [Lachnospiraceae bacterium]
MKHMNKWGVLILSGMMLSLLAGCGDVAFEPTASGIYADKDGSVKSAEFESFDNSDFPEERYNADELTAFVEEAVIAYNTEQGAAAEARLPEKADEETTLPVSVEKLEVAEGKAELILAYESTTDYLTFNEADDTITAMAIQTAPAAVGAGVSLDGLSNTKGEMVDATKAKTNEKYFVLTLTGTTTAVVNGKIAGVSGDVEIVDEHTVNISGDAVVLFR